MACAAASAWEPEAVDAGPRAKPAGTPAGGVAGAKLGEEFDNEVLDNYECTDCGHCFHASTD